MVYVLDHGASSSAEGRLSLLKSALISSLRSLVLQRRFQVIFWQVGINRRLHSAGRTRAGDGREHRGVSEDAGGGVQRRPDEGADR